MSRLSEETKTIITITRHIALVKSQLARLVYRILERADFHDISKFKEDEFTGFVEINRVAREFKYGSPEYKASIKNDVVGLHYSRNSHHPEHHPNGVADMGLLDLIEMVADWKAASETYGQTSFDDALAVQIKRFALTPEQIYVIRLIAKELA